MNRTKSSLLLACSWLCAAQAQADSPLLFQNNSLTYLYGKNFMVEPDVQQTPRCQASCRVTGFTQSEPGAERAVQCRVILLNEKLPC